MATSARSATDTEWSPLPQVRGFDRQFSCWAGGLRSRYRSTSDLREPLTRSASPPLNWRSKPLTCSIVDLNLSHDLRSDAEERAVHREVLFRRKVDAGAAACARGDYKTALRLYGETIRLDPTNHVLYSNRSAIYCKLELYQEALRDAERAQELNPGWIKAYYRKGHALKCMGDYVKALLTYAAGLAEDPKNAQLLSGLVDCAMASPMKEKFGGIYEELKSLNLDGSPFVIVSVIGQELLASNLTAEAIEILESGLKVGTTSLKLRQSVLSSLSSAYWKLNNLNLALKYMQQDLAVATSLGDVIGEARAHSNLGMVYISLGKETEALDHYRHQLALSLKTGDQKAAAGVLSTLGQLYYRLIDYDNALVSHQQCLELLKNLPQEDSGGPMELGRQLFGMGQVYVAKKDLDAAEECFKQHLNMARHEKDRTEEAKSLAALGGVYQRQARADQALKTLMEAFRCSREFKDRNMEAGVCGQLAGIYRSAGNWDRAKMWAEKQLQIALALKEKSLEAAALGNLGLVFQNWGNYENAKRLHARQLQLAEDDKDKRGMLQAYRNMGACLFLMEKTEEALQCHKAELNLCKELFDRVSEGLAHGSLATIYGKMQKKEQALTHLQCQWNLAKENGDVDGQALALSNIGEFLMEEGKYEEGLGYLERFLMLAQEQNNLECERKACSQLGRAHFHLEQFKEAGRYFDQELALAKDLRDHAAMGKAYEALGDTHMELGQLDEAMECEKYHLALAHISSDVEGKLKAMGQIGQILLKRGNPTSAMKVFGKALNLARATKNKRAEAEAYGHLGSAYNASGRQEKALAFLTQELAIQEMNQDRVGQYKAYGHIGEHYRLEKECDVAGSLFEKDLEISKALSDVCGQCRALRNLGGTEEMQGNFTGAHQYYAWMLEAASGAGVGTEIAAARMEAHRLIGISCLALGDANSAVSHLEQALGLSASLNRVSTESEIRFAKSLLHWSLGNSSESIREIETAMRLAEKSSGAAVWGDYLDSGFRQPILEMAAAFQMCLFAEQHRANEALLCVERLRFWRCVSLVERCGRPIRKQKHQIPTQPRLNEALNKIVSDGEVLLYYFQIANHFLFSWIASNNELKMVITRLHPDFDGFCAADDTMTGSKEADRFSDLTGAVLKWRLESVALQTVLENRLAQLVAARETPPNLALPVSERLSAILVRPFRSELCEAAKVNGDGRLRVLTVGLEESSDVCMEKLISVQNLPSTPTVRRVPALFAPSLGEGGGKNWGPETLPLPTLVATVGGLTEDSRKIAGILRCEPVCAEELGINRFLGLLPRAKYVHLSVDGDLEDFVAKETVLQLLTVSCDIASLAAGKMEDSVALGAILRICGAKTVLIDRGDRPGVLSGIWEAMSRGVSVIKAVEAIEKVGQTPGVVVLGEDAKMERSPGDLGKALRILLRTPEECRQALRVIVHLVEKSLQRINTGQEHAMFTSEESVRKKMGPEAQGWKELLECLGFRREASGTDLTAQDASIYFPIDDGNGNLSRGSRILQAFDGLPQNSLDAFSKLLDNVEAVGKLAKLELSTTTAPQWETHIPLSLYNTSGVQGLIASLGFDNLAEDASSVTVKTIRMELTRRKVDLANTCLHALFDDVMATARCSPNLPSPSGADSVMEGSSGIQSCGLRRELSRLRDLEITDFSGMDSDFYAEDSVGSLRRKKKTDLSGFDGLIPSNSSVGIGNKSGRRRGTRGRKRDEGLGLGGYASESDVKRGGRRLTERARGYHSEDEGRLGGQADKDEENDMYAVNSEIMETTARVISVEERNSPLSDLGDSFHEDEGMKLTVVQQAQTVRVGNGIQSHEYMRLETPAPPRRLDPPPYRAPSYVVSTDNVVDYGSTSELAAAAAMRSAAAKVLSPRKAAAPPPPYTPRPQIPWIAGYNPRDSCNYMTPRVYPPTFSGRFRPHQIHNGGPMRNGFEQQTFTEDRVSASII